MSEQFVIITGLSGSGKSAAIRVFEDMDYYCVDNLPVALIPVFVDLCARGGEEVSRVALVIDVREGRFLQDFPEVLGSIRANRNVSVLFFEAADDVLARRFGETRRPHPMGKNGRDLQESIRHERQALLHIRAMADHVIDTSAFTVHDLKSHLLDNFLDADRRGSLLVLLQSFGYKYGAPQEMDLLFDVRFITNPFFVDGLKGLTGQDNEVVRFLDGKPEYRAFLEKVVELLHFLLPLYLKEGKSYLRIGVGCTGGKHRSVAVAEHLAQALGEQRVRMRVQHRDLDRE